MEIQKKTCLINILICLRKFNRLSAFFSEAPPFSNLLFSVYSLTFLFIFHKNSPLFTLDTRVAHSSTIPREKKSETNSLSQFRLLLSYLDSSYFFTRQSNSTLLIFYPRGVDTFSPSLHLFLIYPFLSSIIFVPPSGIYGVGATIPFYYLLSAYLFLYLSEQDSLLFFILTEASPKLESSAGMSTI